MAKYERENASSSGGDFRAQSSDSVLEVRCATKESLIVDARTLGIDGYALLEYPTQGKMHKISF
jgi:hypothetical protein